MKILSIQVGLSREVSYNGNPVMTGIFKDPIKGPVHVGKLCLKGDQQSDLRVHGGPDKAVYGFSYAAYSWWRKIRPDLKYDYGAFGENLTLDDINEDQVCVGDTFEVGSAVLQAAQPRFPCYKLGVKFGDPKVIKTFTESNRPGVYFRVMKEGEIVAGDKLKLISQEKTRLSINELLDFSSLANLSAQRIEELSQIKSLTESWRGKIIKLLDS